MNPNTTKDIVVTVNPIADNTPPVANDDIVTVSEDSSVTINVLANDTDADGDVLSIVSIDDALTTGSVEIVNNQIKYDATGKFEYLAEGETATDSFTYKISDGNDGESEATVNVTINGKNDAPINLQLDNPLVFENQAGAIIGNITFADVDIGDTHDLTVDDNRFEIVNGQLKLKDGQSLDYETEQLIDVNLAVTDGNGASSQEIETLFVLDIAENIYGTNGDDTLHGNIGKDIIYAGEGDDTIYAYAGSDHVFSGGGEDVVAAGVGADTVVGGLGNDIIYGSYGDDKLYGNEGNDILYGESGNDTLNGGADNDTIFGGSGADNIEGGDGIDTASYAFSDARVKVYLMNNNGFEGYAEGDELSGIENLVGSEFHDILEGNNGNNILYGMGSSDFLRGEGGDDILVGGEGYDILAGSNGNDILLGGADSDDLVGELGSDILTGGTGSDSFEFLSLNDSTSTASDTITDFEDGIDQINFSYLYNITLNFSDLSITDDGTDTTVSINGTDFEIKLNGVYTLDETDFVF